MARIGVYVCWCGTNISKMVDVVTVADEIAALPNVVISKDYKYMCSDPGQDIIIKDIKEHNLNRIVIGSCSPRMHELTFRKALEKAGLNPYMLEMANIREHVSWVHEDYTEATAKAKALITAAVSRVKFHEALDSRSVDINPVTLIVGGGIAGMRAALDIADAGKKVYLVEKAEKLGGHLVNVDLTFPYMYDANNTLLTFVRNVSTNPNIELFLDSEIKEINGYVGNFESNVVSSVGKTTPITFGNIILATGLKPFNPSVIEEYGYGRLPNVITSVEFEQMLKSGEIRTKEGKKPNNIAIIHCVGSRNTKYHEYCSRVCCTTALKYANQLRSELPKANIFELYADMRTFGKGCEEMYAHTSKRNIKFFMFDQENELPKITEAGKHDKCNMLISMNEKLSGKSFYVPADMVILMVAMEGRDTAKAVAHTAGISMDGNKFYIEKHPKLDPVATTTGGVYIIGSCQAPKDIPDSIAQASAAAARVLGVISKGNVKVESTTAHVDESICRGCKMCLSICPYSAIVYNADKSVAHVNEILCKGCGTCVSLCRSKSIDIFGYTHNQIYSQVVSLLNEP
jgi:heterodisulfide reductase subunit A2